MPVEKEELKKTAFKELKPLDDPQLNKTIGNKPTTQAPPKEKIIVGAQKGKYHEAEVRPGGVVQNPSNVTEASVRPGGHVQEANKTGPNKYEASQKGTYAGEHKVNPGGVSQEGKPVDPSIKKKKSLEEEP